MNQGGAGEPGRMGNSQEYPSTDPFDYAWKYFALHADQRLRTLHFFLIFSAVIIGGSLTALESEAFPAYGAAVGLYALVPIAFLFWKLDERNRDLIKQSERALRATEEAAHGRIPAVFSEEEKATARLKENQSWRRFWSRSFSYSEILRLLFLGIGIFGATLGTIAWVE